MFPGIGVVGTGAIGGAGGGVIGVVGLVDGGASPSARIAIEPMAAETTEPAWSCGMEVVVSGVVLGVGSVKRVVSKCPLPAE